MHNAPIDTRSMMDVAVEDHPYGEPPPGMPIPDRLNTALVACVFAAALGLLWLASRATAWYSILGVGILFSYLLLTAYALLHEAAHGNLHSRRRWNDALGITAGLLFPVPYSLVRFTHQNHHRRNRTDHEMFDLYYPTDNLPLKYAQWYCILAGLFWPLTVFGAVLIAMCPALLQSRWMRQADPARGLYYLTEMSPGLIRAIQWQVLLIGGFFALMFWFLELRWQSTLVLYGCFAFNWSTRQYVGHAFTPRDVIEGAYNLRHNRLMSAVLLHGEWDLEHHRHPEVSWLYLPRLAHSQERRPNYLWQYWRQWLGPRPCAEPAPGGTRPTLPADAATAAPQQR